MMDNYLFYAFLVLMTSSILLFVIGVTMLIINKENKSGVRCLIASSIIFCIGFSGCVVYFNIF